MCRQLKMFETRRRCAFLFLLSCLVVAGCRQKKTDDETSSLDHYWRTDIEAAIETAGKTDRDLLLAFYANSSGGASGAFREQILQTTNFYSSVMSQFVLVQAEFSLPLNPADRSPASELLRRYRVSAMPLVVLCHPDGNPYARITFAGEGLRGFLDRIRGEYDRGHKLWQLEEVLAKPELSTRQRVFFLHRFLNIAQPEVADLFHTNRMSEIIALDPTNKFGAKNLYTFRLGRLQAILAGKRGDFPEAIRRYETLMREMQLPQQNVQDLYLEKATMHQRMGDWPGLRESLETSLATDPNGFNASLAKKRLKRHFPKRESAPNGLPGIVTTTLGVVSNHYPELAFDGDPNTFYQNRKPVEKGETVTLNLVLRAEIHKVRILTGLQDSEQGRLKVGVLELSPGPGKPFEQIGAFRDGVAEANLGLRLAHAVRLRVIAPQNTPLYVRDFEIE